MNTKLQTQTQKFRQQYRLGEIPKNYSGIAHFLFTSLSCLGIIGFCIYSTQNVTLWEYLLIPFTFFYSNFTEYWGHKGPMHNQIQRLERVFKRHTLQHHHFFTNETMECESLRDFQMILFPPILLIFFTLAFALPMWFLLYFLWSANAAYIFVATSIAYFLNYEYLHLAYHLPEKHWIAKIPLIKILRNLHMHHHDPQLMHEKNFNISYPIFDWFFGTLYQHKKQ